MTGLHAATIRRQIAAGKVAAIKVGWQYLLTPEQAATVRRYRKRAP